MYQEIVDLFADSLKDMEVRSEGMKEFKKQVRAIAESEEYRNLCEELTKWENNFGFLKSVTIGVNLDVTLRPIEAGIVSVNMEHFRSGSIMDKLLRKAGRDDKCLVTPLFPIHRLLRNFCYSHS